MDITLIVKASNQQFDDQTIKCEPSWTIRRLKGHLTEVYPGKPSTDEQKLIYSGQLLGDSVVLKDILRHYDGQKAHTVHLVFTPKNNRHRDFNFGGTNASSNSSSNGSSGTTMAPKASNESGATSTTAESTRSPETSTTGTFGADGLRQRTVVGNAVPTAMPTQPIPAASADYIMGQHLAMQNWMQQAYMQYLNQYMNVISNGQNRQALYASAPTNPSNPIIPQASPQTNVAQSAAQTSGNPILAQTLPNLAYYPYLSTMSSSPMPSASSIPAPITSSGTIPAANPSPAPNVTPGPSSQATIPSPVPSPTASPVVAPGVGVGGSPSTSSPVATTATTAAAATVQQDTTAAAAQAAPAAAPGAVGAPAAAAPARRFPNIVVEEQENRDWLDIFFSMCRVGILMTVVYLYSSPTRCLTVFLIGIMLYLYQIGFFRNNRADRMERARRLVVQQINMAHVMRQNADLRARAAQGQAPAAGAEAAANAQAPSPAAPAPSTATTAAQTDATDGPKTAEASSSSEGRDDAPAQVDESTATTESNANDEMAVDPSNPAPEENRMNINDVAAFLRTLVLSFFTSIIPDTPAA